MPSRRNITSKKAADQKMSDALGTGNMQKDCRILSLGQTHVQQYMRKKGLGKDKIEVKRTKQQI